MKRTRESLAAARDAALERDNYACQASEFGLRHVCLGRLHVHHRLRRSQGGSDDLDNLITLCDAAHTHVHHHVAESYANGLLVRSTGTTSKSFPVPLQKKNTTT